VFFVGRNLLDVHLVDESRKTLLLKQNGESERLPYFGAFNILFICFIQVVIYMYIYNMHALNSLIY